MNYVEPIRDANTLENICLFLKEKNERDYLLFITGLYTGLRISDILKLQVKHVSNLKEIRIKEQKTSKNKKIEMNIILKKEIKKYIENKNEYEYLFRANGKKNKAICRQRAYKIIKEACEKFGIEHIGTHSMRKTFGYHYYKKTKNIALLQNIFNHSSPSATLRYIGINQDEVADAYASMKFF